MNTIQNHNIFIANKYIVDPENGFLKNINANNIEDVNSFNSSSTNEFNLNSINIDAQLDDENIFGAIQTDSFSNDEFNSNLQSLYESQNAKFKKKLISKYQNLFLLSLEHEEIPIDYSGTIETSFRELLNENSYVTIEWFNEICVENYLNNKILINILKLLGNLESDCIPSAIFILGTSLSNSNTEVKEFAVRVLERWCNRKSIDLLKGSKLAPKWLDDYRLEVIRNFEQS